MNINASIVDQRIAGILDTNADLLLTIPVGDTNKRKSAAFVLLCMATALDLPLEEAAELLTDGGNDAGIDGLHIGEVDDGEFTVSLFQGKYKVNLEGGAHFPENDVRKAITTVGTLFDPNKHIALNDLIRPKVEEIRSLVRDGYIPMVRIFLCNNGLRWNDQAQTWIDQTGFLPNQVEWLHWNHDTIVSVLQRKKSVDETIKLKGKAIIEEFDFRRVLIGKVSVTEIAALFNRHNDLLLERNIRRYLGLASNRVNSAINNTLTDSHKRKNFYFFNNGITMICRKFRHNALVAEDYQVKMEDLQIINGGQTCKTIQQTLNQPDLFGQYDQVYVLIRVYELAEDDQNFVQDITYATNSQNPVDLRDLRSNDHIQKQLELGMKDLGYLYKRQREEGGFSSNIITSTILAESVLAIWRKRPQQAKFHRRDHFGALYDTVFGGLNAAQGIMAVLIFRFVENLRKRPEIEDLPTIVPYASHYLAMIIGELLLKNRQKTLAQVNHLNLNELVQSFDESKSELYMMALEILGRAVVGLYGRPINEGISLQQLAATFRRGDLMEWIKF